MSATVASNGAQVAARLADVAIGSGRMHVVQHYSRQGVNISTIVCTACTRKTGEKVPLPGHARPAGAAMRMQADAASGGISDANAQPADASARRCRTHCCETLAIATIDINPEPLP